MDWLRQRPEDSLFLSVITLGKIERGIFLQRSKDPVFAAELATWLERTVTLFSDRILPFGAREALHWGQISARLGHSGADLLIAATALACGGTIVTESVADFEPTGVAVVNPF